MKLFGAFGYLILSISPIGLVTSGGSRGAWVAVAPWVSLTNFTHAGWGGGSPVDPCTTPCQLIQPLNLMGESYCGHVFSSQSYSYSMMD